MAYIPVFGIADDRVTRFLVSSEAGIEFPLRAPPKCRIAWTGDTKSFLVALFTRRREIYDVWTRDKVLFQIEVVVPTRHLAYIEVSLVRLVASGCDWLEGLVTPRLDAGPDASEIRAVAADRLESATVTTMFSDVIAIRGITKFKVGFSVDFTEERDRILGTLDRCNARAARRGLEPMLARLAATTILADDGREIGDCGPESDPKRAMPITGQPGLDGHADECALDAAEGVAVLEGPAVAARRTRQPFGIR